ncbi:unnamed protein product [Owenia fusiformis]|uniref:Uncharacterized protein n=1 Tax=Owenia fusiformis TaxID=6347 RepID=A0A8J1U3T4_OWEFU|nr:unnamed protein product [Owenia fusiformis]
MLLWIYTTVFICAVFNTVVIDAAQKKNKFNLRAFKRAPPRRQNDPGPDGPGDCRARYLSGNPHTNDTVSKCKYYECNGGVYTKVNCQNGLEVFGDLRKMWKEDRSGTDVYPCVKHSVSCKRKIAGEERGQIPDRVVKVCGIDLVWAVDISCSIHPDNKEKVKKFINKAVRSIPVRAQYSRVGAFTFSDKIYNVAYMNQYLRQGQLMKALAAMRLEPDQCATMTNEALKAAREIYFNEEFGARSGRQKALIVLSDGFTYPKKFQEDTFHQAKLNHKRGIQTFVVGLPNDKLAQQNAGDKNAAFAGMVEWNAIASKPENVKTMRSFDELFDVVSDIIKAACFEL